MLVVLAVGVALAAYGVTGSSIYTNAAAMSGGDQKAAIGYIQDPSTLTRLEDVSKVGADKVKGFLKGLGLDASAVDAAVDARQQYEDALGKVSDRTDASLVMKEMGITDEAQYQAIADNTALLDLYRAGLPTLLNNSHMTNAVPIQFLGIVLIVGALAFFLIQAMDTKPRAIATRCCWPPESWEG